MKPLRIRMTTDLPARAVICVLFTFLSVNILREYSRTGHATGLLLLASELAVVVFTVVRRRAVIVDRSLRSGLVTAISLVGPPLLHASTPPGLLPDLATATISGLGLILVVFGKMTLGRSFGMVPANRGVVVAGPYAFVRHPIYTGYLITHAAFLVAHPDLWNVVVLASTDLALIVRALAEERVLNGDETYQSYCRRVSWHLVPGLF